MTSTAQSEAIANKAESTLAERMAFLEAQLKAAQSENAALKAAKPVQALTLKVSEKGALSVYGMGRFPVTLYRGQMERLLDHAPTIRAFIAANAAKLAVKV